MDPATIAAAVVAFLAPYLAEGGKAVAKKAGEALWEAVKQRLQGKPAAEEALRDLETAPQDEDAQAALRLQVKKALAADPGFLSELARLLEEAEKEAPGAVYRATLQGSGAIAQGPGAVAAGEGGVAIGGDVKGSVIVTGDHNEVGE